MMEQFQHIDINKKDNEGNTLLMQMCERVNIPCEIIEILLIIGSDPNVQNKYGNTALGLICKNTINSKIAKIIQLFCSYNANVNLCTKNGTSPLHYICQNSHLDDTYDCIKILIKNGANLNSFASNIPYKNYYVPITLLFCNKKERGDLRKITKMMIDNGVDIHILDKNNLSIIDTIFAYLENHKIGNSILRYNLQILLEFGFKIDRKYLRNHPQLTDFVIDYQNKRIEELEEAFKFIPGNEGMLEAKKEFEEYAQK